MKFFYRVDTFIKSYIGNIILILIILILLLNGKSRIQVDEGLLRNFPLYGEHLSTKQSKPRERERECGGAERESAGAGERRAAERERELIGFLTTDRNPNC